LTDPLTFNGLLKQLAPGFWSNYDLSPDRYYLTQKYKIIWRSTPRLWVRGVRNTYLTGPWAFPRNLQGEIRRGMRFKARLGNQLPGNHIYFWSSNKSQNDFVRYYERRLRRSKFSSPEKLHPLNGDGTAPDWSASLMFSGGSASIQVRGGHNEIPNIPDVHSHIKKFLTGH
jgi:hypothetical protein